MWLPDVNVLVYPQREEMPSHEKARVWLETVLSGAEPLGLFDPTLAGFLRIVTNRRIFKTPTPLEDALAFVQALRSAPAACRVVGTPEQWGVFERLCRETRAKGDDIPDVYLAATAIAFDAVLVSSDRGFARFQGLERHEPS